MVYKNKIRIIYRDNSAIGLMTFDEDSDTLLSYLEKKDLYHPYLEKMSESRKQEWLAVRVLLKQMLGEEKIIDYLPSGKPYLSDSSQRISISHTKKHVAVILNKEKEVAIDIEQLSSRVKKIRSRFLSKQEEKNLSSEKELVHLLLHWSAKESLYKILNDEKVEFKSSLSIDPFEPELNIWGKFTARAKGDNYTIFYFVNEDYVLTYLKN